MQKDIAKFLWCIMSLIHKLVNIKSMNDEYAVDSSIDGFSFRIDEYVLLVYLMFKVA
ncbi:MAG: hypothetical protein AAGA43_06255 [Bacteroidota bacterium]